MPLRRAALRHSTVPLFLLLAGCAVGPDFHASTVTAPIGTFVPAAPAGAARVTADAITQDWWTSLNDPLLVSLEARAAAQNLDLQAALARIGQSRARLQIAGAAALPSVAANASDLRERASPNGILQLIGTAADANPSAASGADSFGVASTAQSSSSPPYSLLQSGVDASWELDLWGRARRMREAARAGLESSAYDAQGVRLAIAAEVASTYIQLRGLQSELEIVQGNGAVAEHSLQLAQRRQANGVATGFDAAIASAELATVRSTIPSLRAQIHMRMNALALLLGQAPNALASELERTHAIPTPPGQVPVGIPSELAQRRPDILAADADLHAATADIGVAKASFYPSISLTGSFGLQSLQSSSAGDWGSRQFAVGPVLNLPLFEGGRLRGNLALTQARQQESAIRFQKTVLNAWHEVDDALTLFGTRQAELKEQLTAVAQSQAAYRIAQRRYEQGASDYLSVLIAQRDLLGNQRTVAQGKARVSMAMVDLYKALGGGWPAPAALAQRADGTAAGAQPGSGG